MTPTQILNEIDETYSEYLEMMTTEEKFILIKNTLAQKLAFEIAEKDYYKTCFEGTIRTAKRINS